MTNTELPKSERMTKSKMPKEKPSLSGYLGLSLFGLLLGVWVFRSSSFPAAFHHEMPVRVVNAGADDLVWLVVGAIWVIAQLAGAAAKKQLPRQRILDDREEAEPPEDRPALSHVEGFADLLRKLSGEEEFRVEPPEFAEEDKPWKPGLSRRNEMKADEIEALPEIQPLRRESPVPAPVSEQISDADIRPAMRSFRSSIPSIRMPALDLNFQTLEKTGGDFPRFGKIIDPSDKKALRRAMLSHIIFSPPKALERT